jgi:hypothetical protein
LVWNPHQTIKPVTGRRGGWAGGGFSELGGGGVPLKPVGGERRGKRMDMKMKGKKSPILPCFEHSKFVLCRTIFHIYIAHSPIFYNQFVIQILEYLNKLFNTVICRPLDIIMSEDTGIEPRTVAIDTL